jgi:hypothetical protein
VEFAATAHATFNMDPHVCNHHGGAHTIGGQLFLSTQTMWRLVQTRVKPV